MANFVMGNGQLPQPMAATAGNLPDVIDISTEVDDGRLGKLSWVSGETKRIALVCFKDKEGKQTPKFLQQKEFSKFGGVPAIWFKAPLHNPDLMSRCTFLFNEAKPRVGTIVLEYETDTNGIMLQGGGYKLKAFVFSPDKLIMLQALTKGGWDLSQYDIMATCARGDDAQKWQRVSFTPAPESLLRKASAELQAQIMAEAESLFNGSLIKKFGKALPDDEIMKLIGGATIAGAVPMMPNAPNPFLGQFPQRRLDRPAPRRQAPSAIWSQRQRPKSPSRTRAKRLDASPCPSSLHGEEGHARAPWRIDG